MPKKPDQYARSALAPWGVFVLLLTACSVAVSGCLQANLALTALGIATAGGCVWTLYSGRPPSSWERSDGIDHAGQG